MAYTLENYKVQAIFKNIKNIEARELINGIKNTDVGRNDGEFTRHSQKLGDSMMIHLTDYYGRGIRYQKDDDRLTLTLPLPAEEKEQNLFLNILKNAINNTIDLESVVLNDQVFYTKDNFKEHSNENTKEVTKEVAKEVTKEVIKEDKNFIENLSKAIKDGSKEAFLEFKKSSKNYEEIPLARWTYYPDKGDIKLLSEKEDLFFRLINKLQNDGLLFHIAPSLNEENGNLYYITTENVKTLIPRSVEILENKDTKSYFVFNVPGKGHAMEEYNLFTKKLTDEDVIPYDTFNYILKPKTLEEIKDIINRHK